MSDLNGKYVREEANIYLSEQMNNPNYNPKPNVCTSNDNNGDGLLKNISRGIANSNDELGLIVYKLRNLYERIFDPNSETEELTNSNKDLVPSYSLEYELKIMFDKNAELRSEILTLYGILESKL